MSEQFNIAVGGLWYLVFVVSLTLHEAAHGLAAKVFGDPTAYHEGLVTLDPTPHIRRSPFGMVVIPIISYIAGGWMFGWASAPYDPAWAFAHRRQAAKMALAGPLANFGLVVLAGALIRIGMAAGIFYPPDTIFLTQITAAHSEGMANSAALVLSILFSLNLILFVFNLIPLPPLDGSGAVTLLLNDEQAEKYQMLLSQPYIAVFGLVAAWHIIDYVYPPMQLAAVALLYPGATYQ